MIQSIDTDHHKDGCNCNSHHPHKNEDCCSHNDHEPGGCSCGCSHSHVGSYDTRPLVIRLCTGVIVGVLSFFFNGTFDVYFLIASYLILGYDVILNAIKNIAKGKIFDENFLMSIATFGALTLGEYTEAAAVMFFYQIGEYLSSKAVISAKNSVAALIDQRPDTARLITDDGAALMQCINIKPGDVVLVTAGEKIPVDGIITKGCALIDTSSLTGEAEPVVYKEGDTILAGMLCCDSSIEIEVTKEYQNTTMSKIIEFAARSQAKKAASERFITSFARIYTPIVTLAAAATAFLPPLFRFGSYSEWIARALNFLVISCPCALVVSIPLTFFTGIGKASKSGILIKNAKALENLSKVKFAAFDKTGTLTQSTPKITEIRANGSKAELLKMCAYAEADSSHPIAHAVREKFTELTKESINRSIIEYIKELPGKGIEAKIDGNIILAGSAELFYENNISIPHINDTAIFIAKNSEYYGHVCYSDYIKPEASEAVKELNKLKIKSIILSGDSKNNVESIAKSIGIVEFYARLLPHEKAEIIEKLKKSGNVLFTGDGINDTPALSSATVGAAMGGVGSDAAIETGDLVIMGDRLTHIPSAIKLSKTTMRRVYENIVISLGIKILVMIASLFGFGGMWPAIFADVGVLVITILNSLRQKKY